jgi:hypothetical protein
MFELFVAIAKIHVALAFVTEPHIFLARFRQIFPKQIAQIFKLAVIYQDRHVTTLFYQFKSISCAKISIWTLQQHSFSEENNARPAIQHHANNRADNPLTQAHLRTALARRPYSLKIQTGYPARTAARSAS